MRQFPNWLGAWCSQFTHTEVPENYAVWTGLWTIASVLRSNVIYTQGTLVLDPHMYIFLVGPSGGGKSHPAKIATGMLQTLGIVDLYQGSHSVSKFVSYLQGLTQKQAFQYSANMPFRTTLTLYSDELVNAVGGSGKQPGEFFRLMTQLWDSRYEDDTHVHGPRIVDQCSISWLALATLSWLREAIPPSFVASGFVSRVITQREFLSEKIVPPSQQARLDDDHRTRLGVDLIQISRLQHEYVLSPDATELHDDWYRIIAKERRAISDPIRIDMYGRENEHVLKVSMCLMASAGDSAVITETALKHAIKLVDDAKRSSVDLYRMIAVGEREVELKDYVKDKILSHGGPITKTELSRACGGVIKSARSLESYVHLLIQEKYIEIVKVPNSRSTYYQGVNQL